MNEKKIQVLDLRGLKCPMPVLKASKVMKSLPDNAQLWLETTDPLAAIDIPAFCNENNHALLETQNHESYTRFLVQKSGG